MQNKRLSGIVLLILGLLCLGGSAAFIISDHRAVAAARDWPQVQGRIARSDVDVTRRKGGKRYTPQIAYDYEVGGRGYRNNYIWLTSTKSWSSRTTADEFMGRYPAGSPVPVFYDPADPNASALIIETSSSPMYVLAGAGVLLLLLGGYLAFAGRSEKQGA